MELLKGNGIPLQSQLRVLDVGGGTGAFAGQLEHACSWTVDLTDLNQCALDSALPRRGRSFYYDIREKKTELLAKYDAVFALDIIEHLEDPREFLADCLSHLKPEGMLLINVPALPLLYSKYDELVGHRRRYTKKTLRGLLEGLEINIRDLRYWGFSLIPTVIGRKALLPFIQREKTAVKFGFQPPAAWINRVLCWVGAIETRFLTHPPLGTSVILVATHAPKLCPKRTDNAPSA